MRFILTSKSWSFAINRAATVAEVVVVAAAAVAAADQAAIVTIVVIVITVIWDPAQCIMATMVGMVEEATIIGTTVEISTCQTYNR